MSEIMNLFLYLLGGIAGMIFLGFFFYYAGRLVGLGVMRSVYEMQDRRTG